MSFLEAVMMICFGASWPMAILKTIRAKNPSGKSLSFLWLISVGYIAGIINKLMQPEADWVIWLYFVNLLMVFTDTILVYHYAHRLKVRNR